MRADAVVPVHSPQLLTVADVALRLALSVRTVRTLVALGKLPIVRVGARAVRIADADLVAFVAERRATT
jgi:excisionase family DNA binding protein